MADGKADQAHQEGQQDGTAEGDVQAFVEIVFHIHV